MEWTDILEKLLLLLPSLVLGLLAFFFKRYFDKETKKREDDKFEKELFQEFNARYDKLNNKIEKIVKKSQDEKKGFTVDTIKNKHRAVLIDYFNICAEEYYWFNKGRIDPVIWKSWNAGMNYWYTFPIVKELWKEQTATKGGKLSYYIENGNEFFKEN